MHEYIVFALLAVNLAAFFLFGADKRRAMKGKWRVPERTLFAWAVLGGAWGAWAGMRVFRHKTRKPAFRYGVPALCTVETLILLYFIIHAA